MGAYFFESKYSGIFCSDGEVDPHLLASDSNPPALQRVACSYSRTLAVFIVLVCVLYFPYNTYTDNSCRAHLIISDNECVHTLRKLKGLFDRGFDSHHGQANFSFRFKDKINEYISMQRAFVQNIVCHETVHKL